MSARVCVRVYVSVCASVPEERASDPLELKFTDSSKLPCGVWGLSLDHLQEQQVLLTPHPVPRSHFEYNFLEGMRRG